MVFFWSFILLTCYDFYDSLLFMFKNSEGLYSSEKDYLLQFHLSISFLGDMYVRFTFSFQFADVQLHQHPIYEILRLRTL